MRAWTIMAIAALAVAFGATVAAARPTTHTKHATASTSAAFAKQLATLRVATAKYVNNLPLAKRDGYGIITKMIPDMGYRFVNPV